MIRRPTDVVRWFARRAAIATLGFGCGRVEFDPRIDGQLVDGPIDAAAITSTIFATTYPGSVELYRIDPVTLQATFDRALCPNLVPGPEVGEITFDATGALIATGYPQTELYRIEPSGTDCTILTLDIASALLGVELIPAGILDSSPVMVGAAADHNLYRVDSATGTTQLIGDMGGEPSGDLAWTPGGLLVTLRGGTDRLVRLDTATGAGTLIGDTTLASVYGITWRDGILYAFTNGGDVAVLDPATAAPTFLVPGGPRWGGATTR